MSFEPIEQVFGTNNWLLSYMAVFCEVSGFPVFSGSWKELAGFTLESDNLSFTVERTTG